MTLSLSHTTAANCEPRRKARTPSLFTFLTIWKERRELAKLSDARLRDIGLHRIDATREAARPVWDLPARRD